LETAGALVEVVRAKATVDGADRGQCGILGAPEAVEDLDGNGWLGAHGGEDALLLLGAEGTGQAPVTALFGVEGLEAAVAKGVPPVLQGADSDDELQAIGPLDRDTGDRLQCSPQWDALVEEILDL
jgi:hypothetical protein